MIKSSLVIVAGVVVAASSTAAAALTVPSPYYGSDTLFNVTTGAIAGAGLTPTTAYVAGGSGTGQSAMASRAAASATQQTAPMSKMLTSGACQFGLASGAAGTDTTNATGIVVGMDAVDVLSSTASGAAASCNGAGGGLAFSNSSVFGASGNQTAPAQNWKYVLALVYGGKDLTTGVVDCAQTARKNLVNNWSALFQNSCSNGTTVCGNAQHIAAGDGTHTPLWHAFRRDEASGTSDVFSSLLSLSPSTSQTANNGFGTSPFCNALNWDSQTANANCKFTASTDGLNHDQWTGPGGVVDPLSQYNIASGALVGPGNGNHRRPPPGAWGDYPDPNATTNGADVLPTDLQDNDPIRRPCIGGSTGSHSRAAEEVCNIDSAGSNNHGNLGLVLPVAASDFLPKSLGLQQYPTAAPGNFIAGPAVNVFTCPIRNTAVHNGECANGDSSPGGLCQVPTTASTGGTTQILASNSTVAGFLVRDGTAAPTSTFPPGSNANVNVALSDGRGYNAQMRNGNNVDGSASMISQVVQNGTPTPINRDFVGGYGRIHTVATVVTGTGAPVGCQMVDATDQIGCLVAADPCSIGYAGDGGKGWNTRPDGALTPPSTTVSALTDGLLIQATAPSAATVQALGQNGEYQLARKLYFNSIVGFSAITAGAPGQTDTATGELALAQFEANPANITPLLAFDNYFTVGLNSPAGTSVVSGNTVGNPFCEDFNQQLVCGASAPANTNACAGNSAVNLPTASTVCGNGIVDPFEECDPGAAATGATATCSTTCRCAGITSFISGSCQ